jgi:hypothetical protein
VIIPNSLAKPTVNAKNKKAFTNPEIRTIGI